MYKGSSSDDCHVAGKRIVCSNRYGKTGCGHTRQLYLADVIPKRQYRLPVIFAFIKALLGGQIVEQAYLMATGAHTKEPRHAWRWVRDLYQQLATWRILLAKPAESFVPPGRSERLKRLLPTLERLLTISRLDNMATYHVQFQRAFF